MKKHYSIIFFALLTFGVHIAVAQNYELHRDELLYLALGQHLDWGYASVPPLIGVFAKVALNVFSDAAFGIKCLAALAGALLVVLVGKITELVGGKDWAVFFACAAYTFSVAYNRTAWLFQPVIFDVLFWTLSAYFFIRMIRLNEDEMTKEQAARQWLPLSMVWGLGFLTKYNIVFMVVAALAALLLFPQRRLMFNKYFVLGLLLGLIIVSPNLFWQWQHQFPVVRHMAELRDNQLVNVNLSGFFISQVTMNLHAIAIWLAGLGVCLFGTTEKWLRPVGWLFVLSVALFALGSGKGYYTLGLYPMLFALGGYAIEKYASFGIKTVVILWLIVTSLPLMPLALPLLNHEKMVVYGQKVKSVVGNSFLKWEDGKEHPLPQDYADMTGWRELAGIVDRAYWSLSEDERKRCVIYCENYGQAGAVLHYARQDTPSPISFSDSFLQWAPDSLDITTFIYINDETDDIKKLFEEVIEFDRLKNPYARETGMPVYICRKPTQFVPFYSEKVKTLKAERL